MNEMDGRYRFNQRRGYAHVISRAYETVMSRSSQLVNAAIADSNTNPEILHLEYLQRKTGIEREEIEKRLERIFKKRFAAVVINTETEAYNFGLYYGLVSTEENFKGKLAERIAEENHICTSYETKGEFDFFIGFHISTLDALRKFIYERTLRSEHVNFNLLPVMRLLRQQAVNHWDCPNQSFRKYVYPNKYFEKLGRIQNKLDNTDLKILKEINKCTKIENQFNIEFLADQTEQLTKKRVKQALKKMIDERVVVTHLFLNWMKLGYTPHFFFVKLKPDISTVRKIELGDKLLEHPEFNLILQHNDANFDISLCAYAGLVNIEEVKTQLKSLNEVKEVSEVKAERQFRLWTTRVDKENWGASRVMFD